MGWIFSIPLRFLAIAVGALVLISGLTLWFSHKEIQSFRESHDLIFRNEVNSTVTAIENFLKDRTRLLEAFTDDRSDILQAYASNPDDEFLRNMIATDLSRWFPGFFTFTLADRNGNDLISDIDGFVGAVCVASIGEFIESAHNEENRNTDEHLYETEIHPQANNYHFDMMASWRDKDAIRGVFFVSFYPDIIRDILKSYESEGHTLILVNKDRENLIEITSQGARDVIAVSRDIFLTEWEANNIRYRRPVSGSRWELVSFHKQGLFENFEQEQKLSSSLIIIGVVALIVFALYTMARLEESRKRAQQELITAKDSLQIKVAELEDNRERLEEQAQSLVEIAESESELSDRLAQEVAIKNRFFSIISHDLKSPFTSLLGMTQLMHHLSDKLTKEQFVDYAKSINETGNMVFELLENLLEWARFQMEKSQIEVSEIPLQELSAKCHEIFDATASEKGVQLTTDIGSINVYADTNMVFLVLRNLIANAIKFTPSGGSINITATEEEAMAHITIRDTGVGMSQEYADKVFSVDEKTTTTGTGGEKGTGLGLPLCKEMVEANSGRIWIESAEGTGTSFHFTLPCKPPEKQHE